jgi:RES domain-containing protein
MQLYRICPEAFLENYSGEGASFRSGGRWNQPGQRVLYFASSAAVAMLEVANYLPSPRFVPKSYRLGQYQLPDALVSRFQGAIPADWDSFPYPVSTQQLGSDWLHSQQNVLLELPSVTVPPGLGSILLFNASHPDAAQLRLQQVFHDIYNPRLFAGMGI